MMYDCVCNLILQCEKLAKIQDERTLMSNMEIATSAHRLAKSIGDRDLVRAARAAYDASFSALCKLPVTV